MVGLLVAIVLTAHPSNGPGQTERVLDLGRGNFLKVRWHGADVSVRIWVEERKTAELVFAPADPTCCPTPTRIVSRIALTVGGKEVFVPRSAYADLLWVREAKLLLGKERVQLIVAGGDGSESYRMVLELDESAVRTRTLFGGELPDDQPLQKTVYYQRSLG